MESLVKLSDSIKVSCPVQTAVGEFQTYDSKTKVSPFWGFCCCLFCFFGLGPHPEKLTICFLLSTQEFIMAVLRKTYEMPRIELGSPTRPVPYCCTIILGPVFYFLADCQARPLSAQIHCGFLPCNLSLPQGSFFRAREQLCDAASHGSGLFA